MAGRNHGRPNAIKLREIPLPINDPRVHNRLPVSIASNHATVIRPHHNHLLEDRIAIQHREIQTLLLDNQRLAATHVVLKQELSLAQQDLHQLSVAAADVKAERDDQVREVYQRSLKLDAEVRAINAMSAELVQVRADVQKLTMHCQELNAELRGIDDDLAKARMEGRHVPAIKAEIETMKKEIQRGRAAIENEKKTCASNLEHRRAMEKNLVALAHEIDKLHAELANSEKRARAAAAAAAAANPSPGYAGSYGNPEMGYGSTPYPDAYSMHQVQGATNNGPPYVSGTMPNGPNNVQQTHAHR